MAFNPSFEAALSTARFNTYRAIAPNDDHAWQLYRWNLGLVAAFTPLACDVEVTLRNTIHYQMTNHCGRPDWWASTSLVLDDITAETLASVVRRHHKKLVKGAIGPGKIVADLTLGTWVMLLSRGDNSSLGRAHRLRNQPLASPRSVSASRPDPSHQPAGAVAQHETRCMGEHPTSSDFGTGLLTTSRSSTE